MKEKVNFVLQSCLPVHSCLLCCPEFTENDLESISMAFRLILSYRIIAQNTNIHVLPRDTATKVQFLIPLWIGIVLYGTCHFLTCSRVIYRKPLLQQLLDIVEMMIASLTC